MMCSPGNERVTGDFLLFTRRYVPPSVSVCRRIPDAAPPRSYSRDLPGRGRRARQSGTKCRTEKDLKRIPRSRRKTFLLAIATAIRPPPPRDVARPRLPRIHCVAGTCKQINRQKASLQREFYRYGQRRPPAASLEVAAMLEIYRVSEFESR